MKHKVLADHPTHFVLEDAGGKFRVAKHGLSQDIHDRIKAFAKGGEVKDKGGVPYRRDDLGGGSYVERYTTEEGKAMTDREAKAARDEYRKKYGDDEQTKNDTVQMADGGEVPKGPPEDPRIAFLRAKAPQVADFLDNLMTTTNEATYGTTMNPIDSVAEGFGQVGPFVSSTIGNLGSAAADVAGDIGKKVAPRTAEAMSQNLAAPATPPAIMQPPPGGPPPAAPRGVGGAGPAAAPPNWESELRAGAEGEQAALAEQARLKGQESQARVEVERQGDEAAAGLAAQRARMQAEGQKAYDAEFKKFHSLVEQYSQGEVDPARFWANRSTLDKVVGGIGLLFGSLGAGATGVNSAVEVIDRAIQRDIEAQKANIEVKGRGAEMQGSLLGIMRQHYGDLALAQNATEAAMYQRVQHQLDAVAARYQGPAEQAQLKAASAQIGAKLAEKVQTMKLDAQVKGSEAAKNWATAAKTGKSASGVLTGSMAALQDLRKAFPRGLSSPNDVARYENLRSNVATVLSAEMAKGRGRWTDNEREMVKSLLPDWKTFSGNADVYLSNAENTIRRMEGEAPAPAADVGFTSED